MIHNKGFTLIELMIVVMIIGIISAVAIPQFAKFRIQAYAKEMIESKDFSKIATMEKDTQRRVMEYLRKQGINVSTKGKRFDINNVAKTNNPHKAEVKTTVLAENKHRKEVIPPVVVTCQNRDLLLAKCTMNINYGENRYLLPLRCERTDNLNEYICEVF